MIAGNPRFCSLPLFLPLQSARVNQVKLDSIQPCSRAKLRCCGYAERWSTVEMVIQACNPASDRPMRMFICEPMCSRAGRQREGLLSDLDVLLIKKDEARFWCGS